MTEKKLPWLCRINLHGTHHTEHVRHSDSTKNLAMMIQMGTITRHYCTCNSYYYTWRGSTTRWIRPHLGETDPLTKLMS